MSNGCWIAENPDSTLSRLQNDDTPAELVAASPNACHALYPIFDVGMPKLLYIPDHRSAIAPETPKTGRMQPKPRKSSH